MNRREAIAALVAMPQVTRIAKTSLQPDDVLVIECDGCISDETSQRLVAYVKQVFPDHKAIVMGDGLKLKVLAK